MWWYSTVCPAETIVSLFRYCQRLRIPEMEFWGVYRGPGPIDPPSRYWLGSERVMLADHLNDARTLMESFMQVHLVPSWDYREEARWKGNPHTLAWNRFITGGKRATSIYQEGAAITYVGDYGYVSVAHGGVGQASQVKVWHDDTELPIEPAVVTWGTTNIDLEFPRYRLVSPEVMQVEVGSDEDRGIMWEKDSNFMETLTVGREYNDLSEQGEFISHGCTCGSVCERCCQTACLVPSNPMVGTVNVWPATYSSSEGWSGSTCLRYTPYTVRCSYRSGLASLPLELEDAMIRLAHTLMPDNPCPVGRDPQHRFWARDRKKREIGMREYLNCPWGDMDGAWWAWNTCLNHAENYGKGGGLLS